MSQHTLYLVSPGPNRQQVILWLRERTGLSLAECKEWADTSHAKITAGPAVRVIEVAEELERLSAVVSAEPPLPKIPAWQRIPPIEQVREQHYNFAHSVLVDFFCRDAKRLWEMLTAANADDGIYRIWTLAGHGIMSVDPAGLRRSHERLKTGEAVIIKLPEPKSVTEAHVVALVHMPERKNLFGKTQPESFRYFTLEQGVDNKNIEGLLVFCEWLSDGTHIHYGECAIEPDSVGFREFIDDILCNEKKLRIKARTFFG